MPEIIQIARLPKARTWLLVTTLCRSDLERAGAFLVNPENDYVEYANCGVTYRFIRREDLGKYIAEKRAV